MRFDDVFDFEVLRLRFIDVLLDVALRIDHCGFAVRANQIRGVRQAAQIKLLEIHGNICGRLSVAGILSQIARRGKALAGGVVGSSWHAHLARDYTGVTSVLRLQTTRYAGGY